MMAEEEEDSGLARLLIDRAASEAEPISTLFGFLKNERGQDVIDSPTGRNHFHRIDDTRNDNEKPLKANRRAFSIFVAIKAVHNTKGDAKR